MIRKFTAIPVTVAGPGPCTVVAAAADPGPGSAGPAASESDSARPGFLHPGHDGAPVGWLACSHHWHDAALTLPGLAASLGLWPAGGQGPTSGGPGVAASLVQHEGQPRFRDRRGPPAPPEPWPPWPPGAAGAGQSRTHSDRRDSRAESDSESESDCQ
jgi:hypothetical protein